MITFETQEDFEKAVEAIIREKLKISSKTFMSNYYISTCYFET